MADIMQSLFGPLDRGYCQYFYYLSIFFFAIFCLSGFKLLSSLLKGKKCGLTEIFITLFQPLLMYFLNRLYFSMCAGSLH